MIFKRTMAFFKNNSRWLPFVIGRTIGGMLGMALFPAIVAACARDDDTFHYNRLLGRGINLGNATDRPREGAWGVTLEADYFRLIKEAGLAGGISSAAQGHSR